MSNSKGKISIGMAGAMACAGLLSVGSSIARGSAAYTQGFEHNTNGWYFGAKSPSSTGSYGITRYQSGSASPVGTINAASGNFYAVVNNATSNYLNGYGDAGYAVFNGPTTYQGPYTMSISVYLDAANWTGTNLSSGQGFMIDESPTAANSYTLLGSSSTYGAGAPDFNMEAGFQLGTTSSGDLNVWAYYHNQSTGSTANTADLASLTQTGWYTFSQTISQGTSNPVSTFSIYDHTGGLVGTTQTVNWTASSNADLGGPNYLWITGWNNGFSNNVLAIDNVSGFVTPSPASFGLVAVGSLALVGGMAVRRRMRGKL